MSIRGNQIVQDLLAQILHDLERADLGEWEMPWRRGFSMPTNPATGKHFNGTNVLILTYEASEKGYKTSRWATLKQWSKLRAWVKKGERATYILRPRGANESRLPFRTYCVFNQDQTSFPDRQGDLFAPVQTAGAVETFIDNVNARIRHTGDMACYARGPDEILMPPRAAFRVTWTMTATEGYYATLLHELVHWTGHESRLDRKLGTNFGDDAYAFEELVAEFGAAFLCGLLSVTPVVRKDHAQYIRSWIDILQQGPQALVMAASLAAKALSYLEQFQVSNAGARSSKQGR